MWPKQIYWVPGLNDNKNRAAELHNIASGRQVTIFVWAFKTGSLGLQDPKQTSVLLGSRTPSFQGPL